MFIVGLMYLFFALVFVLLYVYGVVVLAWAAIAGVVVVLVFVALQAYDRWVAIEHKRRMNKLDYNRGQQRLDIYVYREVSQISRNNKRPLNPPKPVGASQLVTPAPKPKWEHVSYERKSYSGEPPTITVEVIR